MYFGRSIFFPGNGHLRDTFLYLPIIFCLTSDFGISLSLRKIICVACLEVDIFTKILLNIKHKIPTAPPICQLIFPETIAFESSDDIFCGALSSSFLEGQFLSQKTYFLFVQSQYFLFDHLKQRSYSPTDFLVNLSRTNYVFFSGDIFSGALLSSFLYGQF